MSNKLFIGGLNYSTTESKLYEELSKYGKVLTLRIIVDRETGKSKGFGFVTFESEDQAKSAIESLDNNEFDGRRIGVKKAIDR